MTNILLHTAVTTLYFLALINPISKVSMLAVLLNHVVMTFSRQVSSALVRFNLLGALVRLTGLVVMTIGTQMVLAGISAWQFQALT